MNMMITFVLHPLSHYNSVTEPRAQFLLSLLEHLTINFRSIIDVHLDSATRDKLIFPSTITRILCHFTIPFPSFDHFTVMCVIDYAIVKRSEAQLRSRQSDSAAPSSHSAPSHSAPSTSASPSSSSDVSLGDIMAQLQLLEATMGGFALARRQVSMGGFALKETSSLPSPVASNSEDEDDDDGDDDDTSDDSDGDASSIDEMST